MLIGSPLPLAVPLASGLDKRVAMTAGPPASPALAEDSSSATAESPAAVQRAAGSGDPREQSPGDPAEQAQQQRELLQVRQLASREREVIAHEQAHSAVGGRYAGAPSYSYTRGPDGRSYISGGEVSIDVSPVPNDPEATLRKMEVVQRAALAPAEPSGQDLRVAAAARAIAAQARAELAEQQRAEQQAAQAERQARADATEQATREAAAEESVDAQPAMRLPPPPSLELYLLLGRPLAPDTSFRARA